MLGDVDHFYWYLLLRWQCVLWRDMLYVHNTYMYMKVEIRWIVWTCEFTPGPHPLYQHHSKARSIYIHSWTYIPCSNVRVNTTIATLQANIYWYKIERGTLHPLAKVYCLNSNFIDNDANEGVVPIPEIKYFTSSLSRHHDEVCFLWVSQKYKKYFIGCSTYIFPVLFAIF